MRTFRQPLNPTPDGKGGITSYQVGVLRDRARYLRRYLQLTPKASMDVAIQEWRRKLLCGEPALCLRVVKGIYNISRLG